MRLTAASKDGPKKCSGEIEKSKRENTELAENKIICWELVKCGIFTNSVPLLCGDASADLLGLTAGDFQ